VVEYLINIYMGNKVPTDTSYGFVEIELEKSTYTAGDQVNGWVNVSLVKPFLSDTLYLILSGKETTSIIVPSVYSTFKAGETGYTPYVSNSIFYEYLWPLHVHPSGYFPIGEYSFPFSFTLADDLPSSFEITYKDQGLKGYGKTKYNLKAGFKDKATKRTFFGKKGFYINQNWEKSSKEQLIHYKKRLTGCCFVPLGTFKIRARLDHDRFFTGDACTLTVEIDNRKAKRDTTKTTCQLIQLTRLQSNDLVIRYLRCVLGEVTLPSIRKGESRIGEDAFKVKLSIKTDGKYQASSKAKLVQNEFYLVLTSEVDGYICCQNNPHIEFNMKVFNRPEGVTASQFGPEWNPKVAPVFVCPIRPETAMTPVMRSQIKE